MRAVVTAAIRWEHRWSWPHVDAVGAVLSRPVPHEQPENDLQLLRSFGWTSSRATHVYMIQHAPLDELLEHFGLEPIPDAPPPEPTAPS
jgi:hypothetical protein